MEALSHTDCATVEILKGIDPHCSKGNELEWGDHDWQLVTVGRRERLRLGYWVSLANFVPTALAYYVRRIPWDVWIRVFENYDWICRFCHEALQSKPNAHDIHALDIMMSNNPGQCPVHDQTRTSALPRRRSSSIVRVNHLFPFLSSQLRKNHVRRPSCTSMAYRPCFLDKSAARR